MNEDAQAEAWVRKKPKRIIQNQTLIVALGILVPFGTVSLCVVIFWLVFSIPFGVVTAVVLWIISTIAYVSFNIYYMRKDRKKAEKQ